MRNTCPPLLLCSQILLIQDPAQLLPLSGLPPYQWNFREIRDSILKLSPWANTVQWFTIISQIWVPSPAKSVVKYSRPDTLSYPLAIPPQALYFWETGSSQVFDDGFSWAPAQFCKEDAAGWLFPFYEWGCWGPGHLQDLLSSVTEPGQERWGLLHV